MIGIVGIRIQYLCVLVVGETVNFLKIILTGFLVRELGMNRNLDYKFQNKKITFTNQNKLSIKKPLCPKTFIRLLLPKKLLTEKKKYFFKKSVTIIIIFYQKCSYQVLQNSSSTPSNRKNVYIQTKNYIIIKPIHISLYSESKILYLYIKLFYIFDNVIEKK